ncbi:MAG TPA: anthranilate phosphoribosyltransferase [Firmicutes bacterium]|nr:anthranilate phosphoribosyltransferase [Bacillota bacterium]
MQVTEAIAAVSAGQNLDEEQSSGVMNEIMDGEATDAQIAALITALRMKGETEEEITGFARAIRNRASRAEWPGGGMVDTCGTGGDMVQTFNISTTAAFVVAACGVPVAKHGNRSVSSKCGSADVLEALGVRIDLPPASAAESIEKTGIGFLFAPTFHSAMKHAVKARREIGIRTVFNLIGPLVNPAGADHQLMGVYSAALTKSLAEVLCRLGVTSALVVHGAGGLDEISTIGPTQVAEVKGGRVDTYEISPDMFGLPGATVEELRGGDKRRNAEITESILKGEPGPRQDIVVLNAAAALYAAGKVSSIDEGITRAREAIISGEALHRLRLLQQYCGSSGKKEAKVENCSFSAS